jgi:hypothetical protein
MAFIIRVMCQDTQSELHEAWRAINAAPEETKAQALAVLQELSVVDYDRTTNEIRTRLSAKNKVDEIRVGQELAKFFRANYARAEGIASGRHVAE